MDKGCPAGVRLAGVRQGISTHPHRCQLTIDDLIGRVIFFVSVKAAVIVVGCWRWFMKILVAHTLVVFGGMVFREVISLVG